MVYHKIVGNILRRMEKGGRAAGATNFGAKNIMVNARCTIKNSNPKTHTTYFG